ncbi:MAG: Gldg family protein [Planctomycetota bacterium]
MNLKRLSARSLTILNILLFLCIVVTGLLLAERHFIRLDVTSSQTYTLSDGTKNLLNSLKDVLHIKVYMTADLPQELAASAREVRDTFEEFRSIGGRMVNLSFVDPSKDEELKAELNQMGILELRFSVREKERVENKVIFFSAAFLYRNRKEIIKNLYAEPSLELASARAVKKLISVRTPKLAYITSYSTRDLNREFSGMYKTLIESLNIVRVDIEAGEAIPEDADILLLMGPRQKISQWGLYQLDQYLMRGGKLVVFSEQIHLNDKFDGIATNPTDIDVLLASYGVNLNTDMVCDNMKMGHLVYSYGNQRVMDAYPAIVAVDREAFSKNESAITKGLQAVYMPWCSSMTLDEGLIEGKRVERLLVSSPESTVQQSSFNLDPNMMKRPSGEKKERLLGVLLAGEFNSHFRGKEAPQPPAEARKAEYPERKDSTEDGYLAVISSTYFVSDAGLSMMGGRYRINLVFLENLFDYLSMGNDLIGIRMKDQPVQTVDERVLNRHKSLFWFLNVALMPLLVFFAGIAVKLFGYYRKRSYETRMGR